MIETIYNYVLEQLNNNQFASGAAIASIFGSLVYSLRTLPVTIYNWIKRRIVYTVHIDDTNIIFTYLNDWLYEHYTNKFRNVKAKIKYTYDSDWSISGLSCDYEQHSDSFLFWYKGKPVKLNKRVEKLEGASNIYNHEIGKFEISTLFNKQVINDLLFDIKIYIEKLTISENNLSVYNYNGNEKPWSLFKKCKPLKLSNLILNDNVKNEIITSYNNWLDNKNRLKEKGINLSLCHLYEGGPGSGKTSVAMALAYEYKMNIYCLNLNTVTSLESLYRGLSEMEDNSILLIEEIEDVYDGRNIKNENCKIPASGLLNILSGAMIKEGLMVVLTSNDISKLDPALLREGRVDLKSKFTSPDKIMIKKYIENFYDQTFNIEINNFPSSMAQLENWCINNIDNPQNVLNKLNER